MVMLMQTAWPTRLAGTAVCCHTHFQQIKPLTQQYSKTSMFWCGPRGQSGGTQGLCLTQQLID